MLCALRTDLIELAFAEYWKLLTVAEQQSEPALVLADLIESLGETEWDALDAQQQVAERNDAFEKYVHRHGSRLFDGFSDERKRTTVLFFICGCGMHKISNLTKWAYRAMSQNWPHIAGAFLPRDLPNKSQKRTISASPGSGAVQNSKTVSSRGAVHAVCLAGGLLNNKDDKKGYQDNYVD